MLLLRYFEEFSSNIKQFSIILGDNNKSFRSAVFGLNIHKLTTIANHELDGHYIAA